jgi:hypothetical protein
MASLKAHWSHIPPGIATVISRIHATRLPTMLIFLWLIELLSATKWYTNIDEKS